MTATNQPERMPLMAEIHTSLSNSVAKLHEYIEGLERRVDSINPQPPMIEPVADVPERQAGVVNCFRKTAEELEFLNRRLSIVNDRLSELF